MSKENEMLNCPLCGTKPVIDYYGSCGYEIKCPKCMLNIKQKTIHKSSDWLVNKMIEKWNKRV